MLTTRDEIKGWNSDLGDFTAKKLANGQQAFQTTDGNLYTHKIGNVSGEDIYQKIDVPTGGNSYTAPGAEKFIPKDFDASSLPPPKELSSAEYFRRHHNFKPR